MKAVIFARVSTKDQKDGHSLDAQIQSCYNYAMKKSLKIIEQFKIIESSTRGDRPEFYTMIDFIKTQKSQIALVVDKVDRLQRSFIELPILDKLRKQKKLILHFLDIGKLDSEANSQQISFYQMSVVMANAYTNAISDNVKRSVLHKLNSGECIGKAPLGYLNIRDENDKSDVIIDESRAYLIQQIFSLYAQGSVSLGDLEKFSKENNLTNNFYKGHSAKPITKSVIANILKNSFYYGYIYVKKYNEYYPHKYPPLISRQLFDKCQEITLSRSAKNNRIQAIQTSKKDFIFRSLIKCNITGRTVSSDRKEAKKNKNTYLITWDPENIKKKVYVPEQEVLKQVLDILQSIAIPENMLTEITSYLQQSHESENSYHKIQIIALRKQEDRIKEKLNILLDIYLEKVIVQNEYQSKKELLEKQLIKIKTEKEMHQEADNTFKEALITAFEIANRSANLLESSKTKEKRELIKTIFSNLKLEGRKLDYTLRKPFDVLINKRHYTNWLPGQDSNLRPSD